jgi:thiol-disulfide isomerase/thioredoxin
VRLDCNGRGGTSPVSASRAVSPNHLNGSKSSYLQRASEQPIDWYPWGEEAFRKAKDLNRPILLDLGAKWCPYCAQMDRERYERPEMAKFINDHLVSIKVDYGMLPEIAARLQGAQAYMNLPAGLPLTTFLSPSGKLYFGGGYFPKEPRGGKSSLGEMLERALCMFREQRETIESGGVGVRTWERVQLHENTKRWLALVLLTAGMTSSLSSSENLRLNPRLDYSSDSLDGPLITGDHMEEAAVLGKPNYIIFYGEDCFNSKRQARRTVNLYQKYKGRAQFVVIDLDIKRTEQQQELVKSYYRGYIPHVTVLEGIGETGLQLGG